MAKLTKRLLIIAMAVLLVAGLGIAGFVMASEPDAAPVCYKQGDVNPDGAITAADAIYLLYASFPMFEDEYPLNQDCDFEEDGVIDRMDAIYLLYASNELTAQGYPLEEMVHNYHEPVWSWDETAQTASAAFKCGCGLDTVLDADDGVVVTSKVVSEATCTTAGTTELTAKVTTAEGQKYEAVKTLTVNATGVHDLDATPDCVTDAACANCDYEWVAPGHSMKLVRTIAATCTAAGEERYECQNTGCGYAEQVTLEQLPHTLTYLENQDREEEGCQYVKQYKCACGYVTDGTAASDTYIKHDYSVLEIQEATCVATGLKTYKCAKCGEAKPADEEGKDIIPVNENHSWGDDGKCQNTGCSAAKVVTTNNQVDTAALDTNTSLELKDEAGNSVALTMDQAALDTVAGDQDRQIEIKIEQKPVSELRLEENQASQIPGATVYDFSLVYTDNNEQVSNFNGGKVTISLPYELGEGEDTDSIDVWYIDDNGVTQQVDGVYCNGYVTFSVEHFSYYTVTRLTAAERCKRYGHMAVHTQKDATCTEDGYDMTVCQRCGDVTEKEIIKAIGHVYGEPEVKAATCTDTGSKKESCGNCDHSVTSIIPALGHDMKQDADKSAPATCTAAGKTVKVCANGCGHTTEEAIAQLAHEYVKSEEGSQAATCTAGGFELYVCSREGCNDQIKKNETTPLGHSYPQENAQWAWTEDEFGGWTAKVTLTCANGCGLTQKLDAVVVQDTDASQNATCLGSGATVYDGTVFYNNVTYTDIKEITQIAPGHQPGTAWEFNDGRHYRICKVCQEMVDATAHTWGEAKVTKEPTCVDEGEQAVACTVCGYSKTSSVPATGIHDMVDGVCADCGFEENTCRHLRMYATEVDVSQYNVCAGLELTQYSCDCGEVQYVEFLDIGCTFGDDWEIIQEKDEYGFPKVTNTGTCVDCGLQAVESSYSDFDVESCTRIYLYGREIVVNGQSLGRMEEVMHETSHPGVTTTETVELTKQTHGLCGDTLVYKLCPCGEYTSVQIAEETCSWNHVGYDMETGSSTFQCSVCGAQRVEGWDYPESDDPCVELEIGRVTYFVNDQEVFSFENVSSYNNHSFKLESYEMFGDSCTDGIVIKAVCAGCGETTEDFISSHEPVSEVVTDLSGYDICYDSFAQSTCLCGEAYADCNMQAEADNYCRWNWSYDEELGAEIATCSVCGTTMTETTAYGEKYDGCMTIMDGTVTYTDASGNVIVTGHRRFETENHNMKVSYTLTEGAQSCEDGVIRKQYCTDCDYEWIYTTNYHESYELTSYDLSAFGSCVTRVVLRGCACGQDVWMNLDGEGCNWQHVEGSEFSYTEKCTKCGLTKKESWTNTATDDPCQVRAVRLVEFSKEGVDTLKLSYDRLERNHDTIHELTLLEGAADCTGGFMIKEVCQTCGYTSEWGPSYGHQYHTIAREVVSDGELCGKVTMETISCACGYDTWVNMNWEGGRCEYQNSSYSEEDGSWTYTCVSCGGTRTDKSTETPVEGTTCTVSRHEVDIYKDKDGNELFVQEYNSTYEQHDEIYTFRMLGTTCQEGYYLTATCQVCQNVREEDRLYTYCSSWTTARKDLFSHEDICGDVQLITQRCPCGKMDGTHMSSYCNLAWLGWDETVQGAIQECTDCGLRMVGSENSVRRPGTCLADVTLNYTFSMDGQELATVEESYTRKNHQYITYYALSGETCEDGYTMTRECVYCKNTEIWEDTYYTHETNMVEYYDVGDCGGYIYREACACGQKNEYNVYDQCTWTYTGNKDAEGLEESFCTECGIYRYKGESGETNKETCLYEGVFRFRLVKGTEEVLNVTFPVKEERHQWDETGVSLQTPGTTCEAGVVITMTCANCGSVQTVGSNGHMIVTAKTVDLAQFGSACGGLIYQNTCACGQYSYVEQQIQCSMSYDYTEDGDDQSGSSRAKRVCNDCGLVIVEELRWAKTGAGCEVREEGTLTIQLGSAEEVLSISNTRDRHTYADPVYTLVTPGTTCMEGYIVTRTCADCGSVESGRGSDHAMYKVRTIDLAQYGSVCGGALIEYTCPCGQSVRYDFSEETKCDLDHVGIDHWIDGVIEDTYQYSTEGGRWLDSTSYTVTCAVTDPACGLKLRMAEYWLAEDCIATEYQTWQYYDASAAQWVEIDTVTTGRSQAFHNYTVENVNETQADGTKVEGTKYTCPDCGSYYNTMHYAYTDNTAKDETIAENTLGNGEYVRYYDVGLFEYIKEHDTGHTCFMTFNREEHTQENGNVTWYQHEYTYDFTDGCRGTHTYTNHVGDVEVREFDSHATTGENTAIVDSTCTQYGQRQWTYTCLICKQITEVNTYEQDPYGHNWSWNDTLGTYVCLSCDLESANGASGAIVLEDLTGDYGNGTNYVVGYWNRDDVPFIPSVSVVLSADNVVDLTFSDFTYMNADTDGVTALSFSMADVQALAAAAAGNSDSYAIRLTFVPTEGEHELDYAITFDSQSAQ